MYCLHSVYLSQLLLHLCQSHGISHLEFYLAIEDAIVGECGDTVYIDVECSCEHLCGISYDTLAVYASQCECGSKFYLSVHIPLDGYYVRAE